MRQAYSWPWVEAQVAETTAAWNDSAARSPLPGPQYSPSDQREREQAYDKALSEVEREARKTPRTPAERVAMQARTTASFARFSATALDLEGDAIQLLTDDFIPVGTKLARWARRFDESLSMPDIIQACRNAWTACGLQPLFGEPIRLTPSILGYSLLYPYTDNFLDQPNITADDKHHFSDRFRRRLSGLPLAPQNRHESALWDLTALVELQYPREPFPQVYDCMLAIHRAQEGSIAQLSSTEPILLPEILRLSCAKGGTSVLADACIARGWLTPQESRFAFEWGVLLQLGDDLQDVREDMQRGSATLFSRAALLNVPLDSLATQLLSYSNHVAALMDTLPSGTPMLKDLLRMSWRSLIIGAVGDSYQFFTPQFLAETERSSPFRFSFLRARRDRLTSRQALFTNLFNAFLEGPDDELDDLPLPSSASVELGCC
jgi:hypothetical protein